MSLRILSFFAFLWIPLHLYHFRFAQIVYLLFCCCVFLIIFLSQAASSLTFLLGDEVLGDDSSTSSSSEVPHHHSHPHLTLFASPTRARCGTPCMIVVEISVTFAITRLLLMFRASKLGTEIFSVLPYSSSTTATTQNQTHQQQQLQQVVTANSNNNNNNNNEENKSSSSSQINQHQHHQLLLPWLFRLFSSRDTKLDVFLQRSLIFPQIICVLFRIIPSFAAGLSVFSEIPVIARLIVIWWVKRRKATTATTPNNNSSNTNNKTEKQQQQLFVFLNSSEQLSNFTLPVFFLAIAYSLSTGCLIVMLLQILLEKNDFGTHNQLVRLLILIGMCIHVICHLISAFRYLWKPMQRILMSSKRHIKKDHKK